MSKPHVYPPRTRHAVELSFFDPDVEVLLDADPQAIAAAQTPLIRRIATTMEPQKEEVSPVIITCHAELPANASPREEKRLFEVASLTVFSWFIDSGVQDLGLVSVFHRTKPVAPGLPGVTVTRTEAAQVLLAELYALERADSTMFEGLNPTQRSDS